jgi:hypothetical protein
MQKIKTHCPERPVVLPQRQPQAASHTGPPRRRPRAAAPAPPAADLRAVLSRLRSVLTASGLRPPGRHPVPALVQHLNRHTCPTPPASRSRARAGMDLRWRIRAPWKKWGIMMHRIYPRARNYHDPGAPLRAQAPRGTSVTHGKLAAGDAGGCRGFAGRRVVAADWEPANVRISCEFAKSRQSIVCFGPAV